MEIKAWAKAFHDIPITDPDTVLARFRTLDPLQADIRTLARMILLRQGQQVAMLIQRYSCRTLAVSVHRIAFWDGDRDQLLGRGHLLRIICGEPCTRYVHCQGSYPTDFGKPVCSPGQHQGCRVPGKNDRGYYDWGSGRLLESIATQAPEDLMIFRTILSVPREHIDLSMAS